MFNVSAIILAAGKNKRMQQDLKARGMQLRHKLLFDLDGTPIILKTIQNTLNSGVYECIVVLGHFSSKISVVIEDDERVKVTVNPKVQVELSESLLNGAKKAKSNYCLCIAADQPTVTVKTLKNLVNGLFKSKNPENTVSILTRGQKKHLNSVEGLGMPFSCHKNILNKYLAGHSGNLNPILKKMVDDRVIFYEVSPLNDLELININHFEDYLKVIEKKDLLY